MPNMLPIVRSLNFVTFTIVTTTLTLAATTAYPIKTLAQSLSETNLQTGCLSGYPDGTYRGDRAVTRNEFAAGLNTCLNQVDQLLPVNRPDMATRADFQALIERQRELNQQIRELNQQLEPSVESSN